VAVIRVSAVVVRDLDGRLLTVRKRGTARFMFPGGKPEPGETPLDAAVRECAEELGVELDPRALRRLGTFQAAAANEHGSTVEAVVFVHEPIPAADVAPTAEIAELRWLDASEVPLPADLAPLLVDHVLPALQPRR
jgi:8-oxo-dGTP pyrophosphatase MutT (NUDIX family)